MFRQPGIRPLLAAIALLGAVLLFAGSPLVWVLAGRQSESYPELLVLGLGVPIAGLLVVIAAWRAWRLRRRQAGIAAGSANRAGPQ